MKSQIISLFALCSICGQINAQQIDPGLTAAVGTQSIMLNDLYKTRDKTQKNIIAAEAAVTVAMERVHTVEDQMLSYLANVQGAMQNLYQIKRAGELVGSEIPQNIKLLGQAVPSHLKGTAISLIVSDEIKNATTEMLSLYPFMQQLVTSGSYTVNGTNEKHKVNLLNAAERSYVANTVVTKLENINTSLYLLTWQIRTYSWHNLWYGLDPDGWATIMAGKAIATNLIWEWKYL